MRDRQDWPTVRALITGGAGFIGSNLADRLLADGAEVVIVDDLSTGFAEHVPPAADLRVGSITDADLMADAARGCDLVFHHAASRAVLRSVEQPLGTNHVNVTGTLTVLVAARDAGVRRVISASSSSVYGGVAQLPTPETAPLTPKSPYAVTKLTGEHYCRVFSELYGLDTVSLRYFNVYGPRQRPDSQYAAVIPLFLDALRSGQRPEVHGDGRQSRAFTYIDDVVEANLAVASAPAERCAGQVFNIAGPEPHDLLELLDVLGRLLGVTPDPVFTPPRAGDIKHSHADVAKAAEQLGWTVKTGFADGLARTVEWFTKAQPR